VSIAWHTIQATDDLPVELCSTGEADNQPLLRIRSKALEQGSELGAVVVYLDEVRHLVAALVDAAAQLAEVEVSSHD
jgi:hypothetical protein